MHLLAAWNAAQAVRDATMDAQSYANLLEQQLTQWPDSPTSNVAREWLGKLRETEGRWEAAVDAYRGIPPDAEQFATILPALARCWERWIDQQPAASRKAEEMATAAVRFFDELVVGPDRRWPERWTAVQRAAAIASARLRLSYFRDAYVDAERSWPPHCSRRRMPMKPGGPPPSRCWCWRSLVSQGGSTKRTNGSSNWGPGPPTDCWTWSMALHARPALSPAVA